MLRIVRKPLFWLIGLPAVALGAYLAFGVFGIQGKFFDTEVNEDFPVAAVSSSGAAQSQPLATEMPIMATEMPMMATEMPMMATEMPMMATELPATPTALAPTALPEPTAVPAPAGPTLQAAGQFYGVDHEGAGDALIYRQPDGSHVLRLENFAVENAPDMYVYVVADPRGDTPQTVKNSGFLNLGKLKGNKGNQNYTLPAEYDPAIHRSVTIWCERFTVVMATAPLS